MFEGGYGRLPGGGYGEAAPTTPLQAEQEHSNKWSHDGL